MTYNADGQLNTTVVDGSSYTGLYAADGSWNIVINDGSTYRGRYHPCGALNVVVTDSSTTTYAAPNGSMYVVDNGSGGYRPIFPFGNASANAGNFILLSDGSSFLLLTDGVSKLQKAA